MQTLDKLLDKQLNQPAQHLPLRGLSPQQLSQVMSTYNRDPPRATAPLSAMVRAPSPFLPSASSAFPCLDLGLVVLFMNGPNEQKSPSHKRLRSS